MTTKLKKLKTFALILAAANITADQFSETTKGMAPDTIAYEKLKLIAATLNEGWKPDFNDYDQEKYTPFFYMKESGFVLYYVDFWCQYSYVGSRLCYQSEEVARFAATNFIEEYRAFLS